jgi:hypothetical protein
VRHRSAQAKIHLTVIRALAAPLSARSALMIAARGSTKSYGEQLRECGTEQMNREIVNLLCTGRLLFILISERLWY